MTRVFKTRHFARWMQKTALSDAVLLTAVSEMERGLIDADLGGGIVKKRIAMQGHGKRGSTRTLIATNKNDRWFFVLGYEKKDIASIGKNELKALQEIAIDLLHHSDAELAQALADNRLKEVL